MKSPGAKDLAVVRAFFLRARFADSGALWSRSQFLDELRALYTAVFPRAATSKYMFKTYRDVIAAWDADRPAGDEKIRALGREVEREILLGTAKRHVQHREALRDGGARGGKNAAKLHRDTLAGLRVSWERVRKECGSDTAADKITARGDAYVEHGWQAVKQRRLRDEKKNGRWARPGAAT